jgi:hypothetical protein
VRYDGYPMPTCQSLLGLVCLAAYTSVGACASVNLDVLRPVAVPVRSVSLDLRDDSRGEISPADLAQLASVVSEQLSDAGIEVVDPPRRDIAHVEGRVLRYDPGLRALRYVSIGFGTGSVSTSWRMTAARSTEVAACRIDGSVSAGTFGGSIRDVEQEIGQALARFLQGGIR